MEFTVGSMPYTLPMKTKIIHNLTALAGITLLAAGCIQVADVEDAWQDAKPDPALLGAWKGKNDARCAFVKTEKDYFVTSGTNGLEGCCKSFETNGHKYVIVAPLKTSVLGFDNVDDDAKNGTLLRYKIKDDTLIMHSLDANKITEAVKAKEVPGEIDEDGSGSLSILDDATVKWLGEIADGDGWTENVYTREK